MHRMCTAIVTLGTHHRWVGWCVCVCEVMMESHLLYIYKSVGCEPETLSIRLQEHTHTHTHTVVR